MLDSARMARPPERRLPVERSPDIRTERRHCASQAVDADLRPSLPWTLTLIAPSTHVGACHHERRAWMQQAQRHDPQALMGPATPDERRVFGPIATVAGRIVTAMAASRVLICFGVLGFGFSLPLSAVPQGPDEAGSVLGLWVYGIAVGAAGIGGVALAANRGKVAVPFLLTSTALITAGIFS
jgi:hypothetical protein